MGHQLLWSIVEVPDDETYASDDKKELHAIHLIRVHSLTIERITPIIPCRIDDEYKKFYSIYI